MHDEFRPTKRGSGSYQNVLEGIRLCQQFGLDFNILTVVHDAMFNKTKEIYEHFRTLKLNYIQFQPLVVKGSAVSNQIKLEARKWGKFLIDIYYSWLKNKDVGKMFVMNLEEVSYQYFYQYSANCVHSSRCGTNLVVNAQGYVDVCDHLIDEKYHSCNILKTNLSDIVQKSISMSFGKNKSLRPECQIFDVKSFCQGGRPSHLNQNNINMLCEGYYLFFSEVLQELKKYPRHQQGIEHWKNDFIDNRI